MIFNEDTDPNEFLLIQYLCPSKNAFKLKHVPTDTYLVGQKVNEKPKEVHVQIINEYLIKYFTKCYGIIFYQNSYVVLTEFCDRYSLRDIMNYKKITLTEDQICIIIHDLLQAIMDIHKRRILYESIRSSNIFITSDGSLKFDAYHIFQKPKFRDISETIKSASQYPEFYFYSPNYLKFCRVTFLEDIWSIGCMTIELSEGRPPYYEFNKNDGLIRLLNDGFPGFRKGTNHSELFKHFVKRCLVCEEKQRANELELLNHPFIKQAEKLDRMKVLENLIKDEFEKCHKKRKHDENDEEEEEEEEFVDDDKRKISIRNLDEIYDRSSAVINEDDKKIENYLKNEKDNMDKENQEKKEEEGFLSSYCNLC